MFKITAAEKKMIEKKREIKGQKDKDTSSDLIGDLRDQVEEGVVFLREMYEDKLEDLSIEFEELKNQKPYKQFIKVDKAYTVFSKELEKLIKTLQ